VLPESNYLQMTAVIYNHVMAFVSITRLRIRSVRFLPLFAIHTMRSLRQVKRQTGFRGGSLLPDRSWTFWTTTLWDSQDSMRRYMTEGPHSAAMPHLMNWCDEASVVHWDQPDDTPPTWTEADRRMRENGRVSKVRHPSANHAAMNYRPPRTGAGGPIQPVSAR
jgi:hypothetical protein